MARRSSSKRARTPAFILDGSVALAWCFADEASPYADAVAKRMATRMAIVPDRRHDRHTGRHALRDSIGVGTCLVGEAPGQRDGTVKDECGRASPFRRRAPCHTPFVLKGSESTTFFDQFSGRRACGSLDAISVGEHFFDDLGDLLGRLFDR